MTNKHMRRELKLLAVRKTQIKISITVAIIKITDVTSVCQDVEKLESFYTDGWIVKWYNHFRKKKKKNWYFLKTLSIELQYELEIYSRIYSLEIWKNISTQKFVYKCS